MVESYYHPSSPADFSLAPATGPTPEIYDPDLLRAVIYPDSDDPVDLSGDGSDSTYDRVEYKYNRLGQTTGTIATGSAGLGPFGTVSGAWALVIRPGKCKGTRTPINPPDGNSCDLAQALINSAHAVAAASSGQQYYIFGPGG